MRPLLWTTLLLVPIFGCAHTQSPASSAPKDDGALLYTLELVRAPFTMVKVTVEAKGAAGGETTFDIGEEWGGVEHAEDEVKGLAVQGEDGRAVAVEHAPGHTWVARHAPGERLTLSYYLVSTRQDLAFNESYYRAIVRPDLVHLIGETSLIFPRHLDDEAKRHIGLRWRGFAEAGWKVVSSFGAGPALEVTETTSAFRHAVFIASGDLRLVPRKLGPGTLLLGVVGAWPFTDEELADLAARVVGTERAFFDDPGPGFFLISVIPVGQYRAGSSSTAGTGLTHSFATFLSPRLPLTGEQGDRVQWLFGHELFHSWNGQTIRPEKPSPLVYWFTEGFTNFYARRLLYRGGVISLEGYVSDLNEAAGAYQLSPVRGEPNARILADFWKSEAVQKLAYRRGDMVAFLLDRELRRGSGGRRSLDDFMRELVARARSSGERVTTEKLLGLVEKDTSKDFAEGLRKIVVEGATVEVDPKGFGACIAGEVQDVGRFDLGFDFARSKEGHVVTGVVPGGSAFLAGLRDGQPLTGWSVHDGAPEEKVELTIRDGNEERKVRYLPQGEKVPVTRFSVGDAKACSAAAL